MAKTIIKYTNLASWLEESLLKIDSRRVLTFLERGEIEKENFLTGRQLHEFSIKYANAILENSNFKKDSGRPVILAMSPGLDFVISFFACLYSGVICVPVPVSKNRLTLKRYESIIKNCGAKEILCDHTGYHTSLYLLKDNFCQVDKLINIHQEDFFKKTCKNDLNGFGKKLSDPIYIQYTSGSSKDPKGVVLSNSSVIHNATLAGGLWDMNSKTTAGSWLPMYHDMGLGMMLFIILHTGHFVFMSPLAFVQKPVRWLKMISHYKISLSGAPPFAYNLCINKIFDRDLSRMDLSSWKRAYCGAETVPKTVLKAFKEKFSKYNLDPKSVFACYGMAEVKLYIAGQRCEKALETADSVDNYVAPIWLSEETKSQIKIVDPVKLNIKDEGNKGEVWVQTKSKGLGYIQQYKENRIDINDTVFNASISELSGLWLRTGDLGLVSENQLYILGRIKDSLKVNGMNVSPADLECYVGGLHPSLNEFGAAAFRSSNKIEGRAHLLIELHASNENSIDFLSLEDKIRKGVLTNFSIGLDDILILKRGTLERTSSGKIRRQKIREQYLKENYSQYMVN
ncbi:AMP-binding protein [Galbibacter pacificus]|uniref:AMP-binding protein n=1 Tax=Galbibacter pacificus TaxID=2996052 RepID=A0ABT6FNC3_9FLAO|nr:AMP-binding protein [Galbibacter pacificus]MDG3581280.1 AMP-binding protein [Galbibacter pacificus]MDG3584758.1 AMP-binding protein [Galbibacter pacificus]